LRGDEPLQVRDATSEKAPELAMSRLVVRDQVVEIRAVASRAGEREELVECPLGEVSGAEASRS